MGGMGKRSLKARAGRGGSAALVYKGQIELWRYASGRSSRRKSKCFFQMKQGRSRGSSSRSESCQKF